MREILFRGKTIAKNEWYYGSYLFCHLPDYDWTGKPSTKSGDVHYIVNEDDINLSVYPETVGQYTGLKDKNGKKIFDGDILEAKDDYDVGFTWDGIGVVSFSFGSFCVEQSRRNLYELFESSDVEVVGNIFDNPKFLKEE